jgi:hypothetical protein
MLTATTRNFGNSSEGNETLPVIDPDGGLTKVGKGCPFVGSDVVVTDERSKAETVNCRLAMVAFFISGSGVGVCEELNMEHMMEELASTAEINNILKFDGFIKITC